MLLRNIFFLGMLVTFSGCFVYENDPIGPDAISGRTWQSESGTDEIEYQFDTHHMTASLNCGAERVSVTVPIHYQYSAYIRRDAFDENVEEYWSDYDYGYVQESCAVAINAGHVQLEIIDGNLYAYRGRSVNEFESRYGSSNLYSDWEQRLPEGRLIWSIDNRSINAELYCHNGVRAWTSAPADLRSFIEVPHGDSARVGSCSIAIDAGKYEYEMRGQRLIFAGESYR